MYQFQLVFDNAYLRLICYSCVVYKHSLGHHLDESHLRIIRPRSSQEHQYFLRGFCNSFYQKYKKLLYFITCSKYLYNCIQPPLNNCIFTEKQLISEQTDKLKIRSDLNMSLNKYESIKILILKKTEYPTWKVKKLMHLEATDPDYLDVINDGPYMPTKLVPATPTVAEHYQLKEKSEWTP